MITQTLRSQADAAAKLLAKKNNPKATNWAYGSSNAAESVGILSTSRSTFDGAFGPRSDLPASTIADLRCACGPSWPAALSAGSVQNRPCRRVVSLRSVLTGCGWLSGRASHFQAGYVQNMAPLMRTTAQDLVGAKGPSATLSAHVKAGELLLPPTVRAAAAGAARNRGSCDRRKQRQ